MQRDGHGNAVGCRRDPDLVVGCRHLDGEADDLPRRGQPLHDQRQRERQHLRRLQSGNVERGADCGDLRIRENLDVAGKPSAESIQRLAGLKNGGDRQQVVDHVRRADTDQRALLVAAGRGRSDVEDCARRGEPQPADQCFGLMRGFGVARPLQCRFIFPHQLGRTVAGQPLPHRHQRRPANLAGPRRRIASDKKWLQWTIQQPGRFPAASPPAVLWASCDLAQLFEHQSGDRGIFATFDGALELPHQQRLRLRRKLNEIISQPLDRSLAHAPGIAEFCRADRRTRPLTTLDAPTLRSR